LEQFGEVYDYLKTHDHGFDWVVLDSISEIGEVCLSAEKRVNKDARAAYGNTIEIMTVMLKKFRDLPMNVMMTCKQSRTEDQDTGRTHYGPSLPGSRLANEIPYLFDIVGALRVEQDNEGNLYRVLQTGTDLKYVAKDRSGTLDLFEEPNLETIFNKVYPDGRAVAQPEPEEQVESEDENPDFYTAKKKEYYFHPESNSAFILEKGETMDIDMHDQCAPMTKKEYDEYQKEQAESAA